MWMKDGVEIVPSDKYEIIADGGHHTLRIHGLTVDDKAEYTVKCKDQVSSTMIDVKG